jgi:hypothetical protein
VPDVHTICRILFMIGLSAPPAPRDRIIIIIIMIEPKYVRDAGEVALDGADNVSVLCAEAPDAVDSIGEGDQQGGQEAAAAQQLQPLAAKESLVLQRHTCERALRQHGAQQRVVLQNARRHAAAAGGDKSRCGA